MKKILYIIVLIMFALYIDKISAYTEYKVGDEVTYNDIKFYVIKDSSSTDDSVTMLKAEPLTYEEVEIYSVGTGTFIYNSNGYGGMPYGTISSYSTSYVKATIDAWKEDKIPLATEVRLIQYDEFANLGYEWGVYNVSNEGYVKGENAPTWIFNLNYIYWTMTQYQDSDSYVWYVDTVGNFSNIGTSNGGLVVRPVIIISKSALGDEEERIIDDKDNETVDDKTDVKDTNDSKTNDNKTTVKVDNTYMSSSILLIILGFITASISVFVLYKFRNKSKNN